MGLQVRNDLACGECESGLVWPNFPAGTQNQATIPLNWKCCSLPRTIDDDAIRINKNALKDKKSCIIFPFGASPTS